MDLSARHAQCGEDVAAYALGALAPGEARRFEEHLAGCDLCRTDLATLQPVIDVLPETPVQIQPPAELRRRIMIVVEREAAERRRAREPERANWWTALVPRPLPALAAACVLLIAGLGIGIGVALNGEDAREVRGVAPPGVQASLRIEDDQGELVLRGMEAPERGRVLQVWLMRGAGGAPEPTDALFTPNASGNASVAVPGDLDGVTRVLVSEEPRGGSRSPTTTPSLDFRLPSSS